MLSLCAVCSCSVVSNSAVPWTIACQTLLSMKFSRREYWSGLPCPPPGDLPNPGIEHRSPTLQADSLPTEPPRKPATFWIVDKDGGLEVTCLSLFPHLQWTPFQTSPHITIWHIVLCCVGRISFWWSCLCYMLPCSWRDLKDHGLNSEIRFLFCFLMEASRAFVQLNLIKLYDPLLETLPPPTSGLTVHLNLLYPLPPSLQQFSIP